jgi:hypothetical protein
MIPIRPRRSVLYMPGSNARAMEKARTLPADAIILDLEDAVAPDVKDTARTQVCAAVHEGSPHGVSRPILPLPRRQGPTPSSCRRCRRPRRWRSLAAVCAASARPSVRACGP